MEEVKSADVTELIKTLETNRMKNIKMIVSIS